MVVNGKSYQDEDYYKAHEIFTKFRLKNEIIDNIIKEREQYIETLIKENDILNDKLKRIKEII